MAMKNMLMKTENLLLSLKWIILGHPSEGLVLKADPKEGHQLKEETLAWAWRRERHLLAQALILEVEIQMLDRLETLVWRQVKLQLKDKVVELLQWINNLVVSS